MADFTTGVSIEIEASEKTGSIDVAAKHLDDFKTKAEAAGKGAEAASKDLGTLDQAASELEKKLGSLVTAAAIGQFFKMAVQEALQEAEALRTLKFSVEASGQSWDKYRESIEQYTAARQAQTRFDDTITFETLGRMARVTGDVTQAMKATSLAQDIASASGKELGFTTELVAGLISGQERAIMQARKEFGAFVGSAESGQQVLDALAKGFDGAAVAEDSWSKSLATNNSFLMDFLNTVGNSVVPVLIGLQTALAFVVKGYEQLGIVIAAVGAVIFESAKLNFGGVRTIIEDMSVQIDDVEKRFTGMPQRTERAAQDSLAKLKVSHAAEIGEKKKQEEAMQKIEAERKKNFSSTLDFIGKLSTAKNKELAIIGKTAAIANAIISTHEGAAKALGSAPPPFNFILAAAVEAAGLAQVVQIAGVQLARGGFVQGSAAGVAATIGEAGRDEAVLPLEDDRAMSRIAEAIGGRGGGGVNSVQNIFVLPGLEALRDPAVAREVMEIVADQLSLQTPEARVFSRRVRDLSEIESLRSG